jgi:hypothetical protein
MEAYSTELREVDRLAGTAGGTAGADPGRNFSAGTAGQPTKTTKLQKKIEEREGREEQEEELAHNAAALLVTQSNLGYLHYKRARQLRASLRLIRWNLTPEQRQMQSPAPTTPVSPGSRRTQELTGATPVASVAAAALATHTATELRRTAVEFKAELRHSRYFYQLCKRGMELCAGGQGDGHPRALDTLLIKGSVRVGPGQAPAMTSASDIATAGAQEWPPIASEEMDSTAIADADKGADTHAASSPVSTSSTHNSGPGAGSSNGSSLFAGGWAVQRMIDSRLAELNEFMLNEIQAEEGRGV